MKHLVFTVTNDLNLDQRMQRICTTLQQNGYAVKLVGRHLKNSTPLSQQAFRQYRIKVLFERGFLFYAEYNLKLFFYLLFAKATAICAIDLDTIMPCYLVARLRGKKTVYDAHEIFTELHEVVSNKKVNWFWNKMEQYFVPRYKHGYTVNGFIANEFKRRYGVDYSVIRNMPLQCVVKNSQIASVPFIIYQGAVNYGRGFSELILAMQHINIPLHIYGTGNYYTQTHALIYTNRVEDKVKLLGNVLPQQLRQITPTAFIGITIFEPIGLNQIHSLANRFFDYVMAGIPQICVAYPEYVAINNEYNIAYLINDIKPQTIANAVNTLINNTDLYNQLKANCVAAQQKLNWQNEEIKLIEFWKNICI